MASSRPIAVESSEVEILFRFRSPARFSDSADFFPFLMIFGMSGPSGNYQALIIRIDKI